MLNKIYQNSRMITKWWPRRPHRTTTRNRNPNRRKETLNLSGIPRTLKIGNPYNGALPLLLQHKEGIPFTKGETKYPLSFNGDISLDFGEVRLMGLNSHLRTNNCVPLHVDVHPSAHPLYTLRIPWCISSTIHFTLITINKIQIQHVHVQRCTSQVCSFRLGFRLWTKIFTTTLTSSVLSSLLCSAQIHPCFLCLIRRLGCGRAQRNESYSYHF